MPDARREIGLPLHTAVVVGLLLASLDTIMGVAGAGNRLAGPVLTGLLPLAVAAFAVFWLAVGLPLVHGRGFDPAALVFGFAAALVSLGTLLTLSQLVRVDAVLGFTETRRRLVQIPFFVAIGVGYGVLVFQLLARHALSDGVLRGCARAAQGAALVLLCVAAGLLRMEATRDLAGVDGGRLLPYLAGAAAVAWFAWRAPLGVLLAASYAGAAVAVAAPLLLARPSDDVPPAPAAAVAGPPLVLVVSVDTLRRDALSAYATSAARAPATPAFDALSADSVTFEAARSAAPWTLPALATVMTGVPVNVHRLDRDRPRLPEGLATLAEAFARGGYRTALFASNPWIRIGGLARGFQTARLFPDRQHRSIGAELLGRALGLEDTTHPGTDELTDRALGWLDAYADEPAFVWIHYLDPHSPYAPPPELVDADARGEPAFRGAAKVVHGSLQVGAERKRRARALYDGEVRLVDRNLARLIDALKRRGLYDEALIAVLADHGEEFWEHGRAYHGHTLFDELLRVPLFVKLPARSGRAGARVDAPVSTGSLAATLLDESGLDSSGWKSFYPPLPLRSPGEADGPPVFSRGTEYFERRSAVLVDGQKLVVYLDSDRRELYDLRADPGERCDRAAAEPERVAALEVLYARHEAQARAARRARGLERAAGAAQLPDAVQRQLEALGYAE